MQSEDPGDVFLFGDFILRLKSTQNVLVGIVVTCGDQNVVNIDQDESHSCNLDPKVEARIGNGLLEAQ